MGVNETPSTRRRQNPGFAATGNSYSVLLIIACMCVARTLMTLHVEVGNDCSTQQLVDPESFGVTKHSETTKYLVGKETAESTRATEESETTKDLLGEETAASIRATEESEAEEEREEKKTFENSLPPLSHITQQLVGKEAKCEKGLIYKTDFVVDNAHDDNHWNHIPKIIHQTSRSRCLTQPFNTATSKWSDWRSDGWSYYFHDDDAMHRMFEMNYEAFPLLKDVYENCLISGTARADLWRYLVLWQYGGIYSDLDTTPNNLKPDTFSTLATEGSELETFFVIEAWHFLSQYFFAIAPRHPLMHHTIVVTLHNLLAVDDTVAWDASRITGPKALHQGFVNFLDDAGIKPENGRRGFGKEYRYKHILTNATIVGTANYTVGSYGSSKDSNFWVWRYDKGVTAGNKNGGYAKMGMEHFGKLKERPSGISCQQAIQDSHYKGVSAKYIGTKKV